MEITNNLSVIQKVEEIGINKAVDQLMSLCQTKIERKVIFVQVDRLIKKHRRLIKDKHRVKGANNLDDFHKTTYTFPVPKSSSEESGSMQSNSQQPFNMQHDNPQVIAMAYKNVAVLCTMIQWINEITIPSLANKSTCFRYF